MKGEDCLLTAAKEIKGDAQKRVDFSNTMQSTQGDMDNCSKRI